MDTDQTIVTNILLLVFLIFMSGVFSASETALTAFRSIHLEEIETKYPREAFLLKKWLKYPNQILTGMLLGNNIVNILASAIATGLTFKFMGGSSSLSILVSTGIMTIVILIFGEITPKVIAKNNAITISRMVIKPMYYLAYITKPIVFILMGISKMIGRLIGIEIKDEALMITEKDIISFVNVGEAEGIIEEGEKEMIHSIFEFGETTAKEVMTPRTSVYSVEATKTIDDIWDELLETGFSRIPVYEDTIDNIAGILYVKDILNAVKAGNTSVPIKQFLREAYFVPETKSIIEILKEFQVKKVHIAIVVDEYGGVVGVVTIEDLIEEIVGEIRDEFDTEEEDEIVKHGENQYIIDAMIDIETLNKKLDIFLPLSEDYESLAGLIMSEISKVAVIGDEVEIESVKIRVLELNKMRISKVLLERLHTDD
ncbi:MAG: hemolysin family protein [Fusobacteriaceae bacterium]